jgi:hypothetical protein
LLRAGVAHGRESRVQKRRFGQRLADLGLLRRKALVFGQVLGFVVGLWQLGLGGRRVWENVDDWTRGTRDQQTKPRVTKTQTHDPSIRRRPQAQDPRSAASSSPAHDERNLCQQSLSTTRAKGIDRVAVS